MCVCVYTYRWGHVRAKENMQRSKDNLQESALCLCPGALGLIQVVRMDSKCFYLLTISPALSLFCFCISGWS